MGIVLNEREAACEAIRRKELGRQPSETLRRVAGYIREGNKRLTKRDVRKQLEMFLLRCDSNVSLPNWSKSLSYAVSYAFKHGLIQIESLLISKPEMDRIDSLESRQAKRLAFVLLCLAKYWDTAGERNDHWVNCEDKEIMKMANINTSIRRQCALYALLKEEGFIEFAKSVDNINVRVCFVESGETAMAITDLRNLGYQYLKFHGEPYFECRNCGIITRYRHPGKTGGQKYCDCCAATIHAKQKADSNERQRTADND